MILSGPEILSQIEKGRITIDPFNPAHVNPASVDLTLGSEVAVYHQVTSRESGWANVAAEHGGVSNGSRVLPYRSSPPLDTKKPLSVRRYTIDPEQGWTLNPGVGYLMHTTERVGTNDFVPILDGKSSIGRLFIKVHETAGFGDPGFNGQYTLEVTAQFPVIVYPGMRICQIRFHAIQGEVRNYQNNGSYTGELASGPIPSQAYRSAFRHE
jgi:dCTP deaminase